MTPGDNRGIKELRADTGYGPRAALIHRGGADTWRTWCSRVRYLDYSWRTLGLRRVIFAACRKVFDGVVREIVGTVSKNTPPPGVADSMIRIASNGMREHFPNNNDTTP